jgi:hypothetical protein
LAFSQGRGIIFSGEKIMSDEKQLPHSLVDRLRGKALSAAREVGMQLSQQVGVMETVKDISAPAATPTFAQEQSAPVRERHVAEGAAKGQGLSEIARSLRQAGVTGGRAANDVAPAKQTPAVEHKQSRGRGR